MIIERLPYQSVPGFDCRRDHANCPACRSDGDGDHGASGGTAWFAVRTQIADGRHVAVVFRVLLSNYLPCTPVPPMLTRPRGAELAQHIDGDVTDCEWMPGGRCDDGPGRGQLTFLGGDELYREHGNDRGDDNQSEEFWLALEGWLRSWASEISVMS